jgi:MFS family permease
MISTYPPHHQEIKKWQMQLSAAIQLSVSAQWMGLLFLPALYEALSDQLGFNSSQLGSLQTMRLMAMFSSMPFFASCLNRSPQKGEEEDGGRGGGGGGERWVLFISLFVSSICTLLTPLVYRFEDVMILNLLSGFFLGGVIPVTRSLVAQNWPLETRGSQYGLIELSQGVGGFMGAGIGVVFNKKWQHCFISIGVMQLCLSFFIWAIPPSPPPSNRNLRTNNEELTRGDLKWLLGRGVVRVQLLQGMFGAFPWAGLSFMMLWFEKMGFTLKEAILVYATVGLGAALGGWVGGRIGDRVAQVGENGGWGKRNGRIVVSHFSVWMGIIIAPLLLKTIPHHPSYWGTYVVIGGLMGLLISWPAANQSANISDCVPDRLHPALFSILFWAEGTVSAVSPLLIGVLNDLVFNAKEITPVGGHQVWLGFPEEKKQVLLDGFANSMTLVCCCCWFIMQLGYFKMYKYYPLESLSLNAY